MDLYTFLFPTNSFLLVQSMFISSVFVPEPPLARALSYSIRCQPFLNHCSPSEECRNNLGEVSGELEWSDVCAGGLWIVLRGLGSGRWICESLLPYNFVNSGRKR